MYIINGRGTGDHVGRMVDVGNTQTGVKVEDAVLFCVQVVESRQGWGLPS